MQKFDKEKLLHNNNNQTNGKQIRLYRILVTIIIFTYCLKLEYSIRSDHGNFETAVLSVYMHACTVIVYYNIVCGNTCNFQIGMAYIDNVTH